MGTIRVVVLMGLAFAGCSGRGPMRATSQGASRPNFESVWRGLRWGMVPAEATQLLETATPFQEIADMNDAEFPFDETQRSNSDAERRIHAVLSDRLYGRITAVRMFFPDGGLRRVVLEPRIEHDSNAPLGHSACRSAFYDFKDGLDRKNGWPDCTKTVHEVDRATLGAVCEWRPDPDLTIQLRFRFIERDNEDACRLTVEYLDRPWVKKQRSLQRKSDYKKL